ncbi:MAG: Mur ligase family protein [Candidatus Paceibacterota bacterium]
MQNYKEQFKGKKITVMGLGILGRGLGYTKFLAECGADLIVTDLKPSTALRSSLNKLRTFKNPEGKRASYGASIKFVLSKHRLEDFRGRDMVIKAAGVPLDSIYIEEAQKSNVPVEMDVSLFVKCAPEVMVIGVTGTRGKSMVTALIYEILKQNEKFLNKKVYIGGNVRGVATLPLLAKVRAGDILICELDSWQLQGFGDAKISPHISVFTSFMPDHMNYYKNDMKKYFNDKANIFSYQNKEDVLIIRPDIKKLIHKNIKSKLIVVKPDNFQEENKECAIEVAKLFKIPNSKIKQAIKNFKGLEGRLQYVKTIRGVKIYNDNNATTPEATMAGIEALKAKNIVLICGGADKGLNLENFEKTISRCKAVVLIPGTGTEKLTSFKLKVESHKVKSLDNAIKIALGLASRGDIILFSPAFASFGMFNNEYERNDLFMKIIKKLK